MGLVQKNIWASVKNLSLAPLPVNETSQTYSEYQSLSLNILYSVSTKSFKHSLHRIILLEDIKNYL